jgi:hypothetical protein
MRKFVFEVPNATLRAAGVKREDPAFDGIFINRGYRYSGRAYAFSPGCAPLAYDAAGPVSPDFRQVVLTGRMPVRDVRCNIVSYQEVMMTYILHDRDDNWGQTTP